MHPAPSSHDSTHDLLVESWKKKVTSTGVSAPHLPGRSLIDHPVGHALANHDSRAVSVGPDAIRHDRRAGNPQPLHPAYPAVLVYHDHLAGVRTHLRCCPIRTFSRSHWSSVSSEARSASTGEISSSTMTLKDSRSIMSEMIRTPSRNRSRSLGCSKFRQLMNICSWGPSELSRSS